MISFRFHLVSLIAVFLALGLGILVGSSVVDRVIVDNLQHEINSVKRDSNQAKADLKLRDDNLSKLDDFVKKSALYAIDQRLIDVPVAVVAERGVDASITKATLAMLRAAGADVPGILWLTDKWRLDNPDDLVKLQDTADVTGNNAGARAAALQLLARRLEQPPPTGRRRTPDIIEPLRKAGFLDFTDGDTAALAKFPKRAARVLVVTGTNSRLTGTNTTVAMVTSLIAADAPSVVGEVYDSHDGASPIPQRGASVAPIRGDSALQQDVSTVDDLELAQGQVSAVIALEQLAGGTVGHYGYGQGASDGPLPPHAS
jgi:copper transport outer membrane protein MctB